MASIAESSLGSVPIPQIDTLRQHMLKHAQAYPVVPGHGQAPDPEEEEEQLENDASSSWPIHVQVPASATAITDPSQNATQALRSKLRRRTAHLIPSASAPEKEMETMLDGTWSQKAFQQLTKAASFHAYPDGDTQPMESQVYRDFDEPMAHYPKETVQRTEAEAAEELSDSYDASAVDRTQRTCKEGDTGYIDLERAFQPPSPTSSAGFDELLASQQTQIAQHNDGFAMPETPALAGRKRGSNAEVLTSATNTTKKTPAYSQLFGVAQNGKYLSATQLFDQTQAPSSPMPDQIRSDPVVTRPSPNLNGPNAISSPLNAFSSPILNNGLLPPNTADPRITYTSMLESQERRNARFKPMLERRAKGDDDFWGDDDDDDDEAEHGNAVYSRLRQRGMRRAISDQALLDTRRPSHRPISSSSRPSSVSKVHSTANAMKTSTVLQRGERIEFKDGFPEDDSDDDEAEDDRLNEQVSDNDEYDEFGQMLRSQINGQDKVVPVPALPDTQVMDAENVLQTDAAQMLQVNHTPTQQSTVTNSQPLTQKKRAQTRSNQDNFHSSSISFIPGSQYTGRTSEDLARVAATQYSRSSQPKVQEKIASSPPLPQPTNQPDDQALMLSDEHATCLADVTRKSTDDQEDLTAAELEVPESDLPETQARTNPTVSRIESNSFPVFFTAKTNISNHTSSPFKTINVDQSPRKPYNSQQSRNSEFSPRKAAGVRHFSEIAGTTPPEGSGQTQADINAVVNGIMTAEDREHMATVVETPNLRKSKRRKLFHELSETGSVTPHLANNPGGIQGSASASLGQQAVPDGTTHEGALSDSTSPSSSHTRLGKGKQKGLTVATNETPPESSSESVRLRENAGAQAVSQLLSGRATRSLNQIKGGTRGGAVESSASVKLGRDTVTYSKSDGRATRGKGLRNSRRNESKPRIAADDTETPIRRPAASEVAVTGLEKTEDQPRRPTSNPERVFALFKGKYNQFFPASWLGHSGDASTSEVRFDDGTITAIDTQHVRALDLRIGDTVKVDCPNMRKESWIVAGFGTVIQQPPEQIAPNTDVHGQTHVTVQAKSSRTSITVNDATVSSNTETHEVLITNVYITMSMWKNFADRIFAPPSILRKGASRAQTPSTQPQTPVWNTPASRTRRSVQSALHGHHVRSAHIGEGSAASPLGASTANIFKGMAFAVSFSQGEEYKSSSFAALIRRSGGIVLDASFLELFDVPAQDSNWPTPSKKSPRSVRPQNDGIALQIKSEFRDLGFVALISNSHHRKAKYIQALALGLPTLSARWIADCLDAEKNPSINSFEVVPLGWSKYLLPAGESSYLDGAIRSRTSILESEQKSSFSTTIASRPRLLKDEGVLLFPGKDKGSRDKCDMFAFLTLALGASRVRRVTSVKELTTICEQEAEAWKWIYVDGSVTDAVAAFSGGKPAFSNAGTKKRKRGQDSKCSIAMSANFGAAKVVNDEFVIQSLILGALVD